MDELKDQPPEIDYLSKDYNSFRRLMLDHLALSVPDWQERSEADLGVVIVEILAYAADYLSYYQDAVATEAYLGRARLRPSIKRHVRLLDYPFHEGCNARAWVQLQVSQSTLLPKKTQLLSHIGLLEDTTALLPGSPVYELATQQAKIFETMHDIQLFPAHNEIEFYSEEGEEVSLYRGCRKASLLDENQQLQLQVGDVLVFEEVKNVVTGETIGADPDRHHAVRLTKLTKRSNILWVEWAAEDAMPFDLRIAVRHQGDMIPNISVARGNIVLADHGQTIRHEYLPDVPISDKQRYRPCLQRSNLVYRNLYNHEDACTRPALAALKQDVEYTMPALAIFQESKAIPYRLQTDIRGELSGFALSEQTRQQLLTEGIVLSQHVEIRPVPGIGWELHDIVNKQYWLVSLDGNQLSMNTYKRWTLRRDLLSSLPLTYDYTVDTDEDRRAQLRFGFAHLGRSPSAGDTFVTTYRIGGGTQGNLKADTISHIVATDTAIIQVRNPIAAQGGTDPETIESARLNAPSAFSSRKKRCVIEQDYMQMAESYDAEVANAVAQLRWMGSWYTAFIYVQRRNPQSDDDLPVDDAFKAGLARFMDDFRLTGYEIEIQGPYYVALQIVLRVHVKQGYAQSYVSNALSRKFNNRPGGFFYPGNFTFGKKVYQSQVISTAMAVLGVMWVEVKQFSRLGTTTHEQLTLDEIVLQPLEIARLANDPHHPENGTINFLLEGGL